MKTKIKFLLLIAIFLPSVACSLPFLAGDGTDPENTEVNTPESSTPVASTPEEVTNGNDPCLTGVWTQDTYALNNKLLDLTQSSTMYVVAPSALVMEFREDGSYTINGETIIRSDIPTTSDYMEITGNHSGQGFYSADGASITLRDSTYSIIFGTMTMSIDGEITEAPISTFSLPEDFMTPPSSATYLCLSNTLQITYEGTSGRITEEWIR